MVRAGPSPVCDAGFQQFGGNTTCLQITFPDMNRIAIIDAGTGLRNLGRDIRAIGHQAGTNPLSRSRIFTGTTSRAFRSFAPAYDPRQKITIL